MAPNKSSWDPRDLAIDPGEPIDPLADPAAPKVQPPPPTEPRQRPAPPRRSAASGLKRPLAILGLAGVVAGGIIGYQELRPSPMLLLNGFDFPVTVTLSDGDDPIAHTVPARGRIEHATSGVLLVRATAPSGSVLAEETVDVPRGHDLVAYNVLGAAAVYAEEVIYTTSAAGLTSRPPQVEQYAGQTFITRRSVDYVFEMPAEEISLNSSDSEASRWHFDYIGDGGWAASVNVLMGQGAREQAQRVIEAVLREDPQNAIGQSYRSYLDVPATSPGQPPGLQPPAADPRLLAAPPGQRPTMPPRPANPGLAPPVQPPGSAPK